MNAVDYDKRKFVADGYGNLYPINKSKKAKKYKGYTIKHKTGTASVKVWNTANAFVGTYKNEQLAIWAIDAKTWKFGEPLPKPCKPK
jgi:cell division protein FtsI/penicillin-binding protein 2